MKQEIRQLLADINESYDNIIGSSMIPDLVDDYNSLLERLQEKYPSNSIISKRLPINYQPFGFQDPRKEIVHNLKLFLENLNGEPKTSSNNIQITIGAIHGNLTFDNIIQTIQHTNITNKIEVINYVKEFRNELQKTNPDKSKLKNIIGRLEDVGVGVVTGLLVEAGKRFLGL